MPQCSVTAIRKNKAGQVPSWITLRPRQRVCSNSVVLRSQSALRGLNTRRTPTVPPRRTVVRNNTPAKKKTKKKKTKLIFADEVKDENIFYGHAFDVLLALGLVPKEVKKEDITLDLDLNRMHVMDVDCEKSSEIVAASAPDIISVKEIETKVTTEEDIVADTQNAEVTQATEIKPTVDSKIEEQNKVEEGRNHEPLTNGELNGEVSGHSDEKFEVKIENCVENGEHEESEIQPVQAEVERTGDESKDDAKERVADVGEVKENGSGGCSEEDDRNSVTSSQSRKRTAIGEVEGEGSSSESDAGGKRVRIEREGEGENDGEDERERLVREYVDDCTESVDDMSRAADKLTREIGALGELLRAKELEWNSILRLRKLKEEMLERLLRKRRLAVIMADNAVNPEWHQNEKNRSSKPGGLMMVPIISSSPGHVTSTFTPRNMPSSSLRPPDTSGRLSRLQRPILPKPILNQNAFLDQNSIIGEGRQGPILDVKSIIADYRSRHPENVPRRGRRMKPLDGGGIVRGLLDSQPAVVSSTRISGSPALMSMANMALGSGSHVRSTTQDNAGPPYSLGQENSRPSSTDSSRSGHQTEVLPLPAPGLSFKDALVQFAKMSQPPPLPAKPPPPPPPYPEVTLHPVPAPHSPPAPHSSLLHGILTKSAPPAHSNPMTHIPPPPPSHRPTTFSPTLARLLTAPERTPTTTTSHFRPPMSRVSICELLSSSKKSRNEITITPVSAHTSSKAKEDVVLLQDDDEETDSADRLVIDEGRDTTTTSNEVPADEVPECQGCRQRSAQFVCAGCGNQWYCSRECQVSAWEEHSEMCSG